MLYPGLCSVTFFKTCDAEAVLRHAADASLASIEWGDKPGHVPAGHLEHAQRIGHQTREAGLAVAGYGSYYRLASDEPEQSPFEAVLETAEALGAPVIRVWAGQLASDAAPIEYRHRVADEARQIADLAQEVNIQVALEYHGGTLTDTNDSALQLLGDINHPNLLTYWQPPQCTSREYRLDGLRAILPWLANIHVFHWTGGFWPEHNPTHIGEGSADWLEYLSLAASDNRDHHALLEFIPGDDPAGLPCEAEVLRQWTDHVNAQAAAAPVAEGTRTEFSK